MDTNATIVQIDSDTYQVTTPPVMPNPTVVVYHISDINNDIANLQAEVVDWNQQIADKQALLAKLQAATPAPAPTS